MINQSHNDAVNKNVDKDGNDGNDDDDDEGVMHESHSTVCSLQYDPRPMFPCNCHL